MSMHKYTELALGKGQGIVTLNHGLSYVFLELEKNILCFDADNNGSLLLWTQLFFMLYTTRTNV